MPADTKKHHDYQTIKSSAKKGEAVGGDQNSLKPSDGNVHKNKNLSVENLANVLEKKPPADVVSGAKLIKKTNETAVSSAAIVTETEAELSHSEQQKHEKREKKAEKDRELLSRDTWIERNGHTLSYIGLYLFSVLVLFRPYELIPSLSFLSATAFYFAAATLAVYIPTQLATEGNLTTFSTEVKAILAMTVISLLTIPIAKDSALAWETFNDQFVKAVLMFIVMVNVLRTRRRLMGMLWLSIGIGLYLSYTAITMYARGDLKAEGYRVAVEMGGLFGNPNDMALHLVTMTPLIIVLGIASRNKTVKIIYFIMAALFIAANMVTYSRGGFLGLLVAAGVLVWKLGRRRRFNVTLLSVVVGGLAILLAPGDYGLRILSIFIPGLDAVGSSDQRKDLLTRSLLVTARNPWGIGIGNFPVVGYHNLQTHNAFTQVSSEIGVLGLLAYLIFMISPYRKLAAIERTLFAKNQLDWFYYLAIGFQASIVGYLVSSFFAPVAYNWYIYYLIAYGVAFRRIFRVDNELNEDVKTAPLFGWQTNLK